MFFLLRVAFWLCVVCVLLPGGAKTPDATVDAASAVSAAGAAVSDMRGFCERRPDACEVGGQVATVLGHKAEAGARTIWQFVSARIADSKNDEQPAGLERDKLAKIAAEPRAIKVSAGTHGTLNETDMVAPWRAPVPQLPRRDPRGKPSA